jgi:hypothetical protein
MQSVKVKVKVEVKDEVEAHTWQPQNPIKFAAHAIARQYQFIKNLESKVNKIVSTPIFNGLMFFK